jgi:hypothetical protein
MDFDAIWISPIINNKDGKYYGYSKISHYKIIIDTVPEVSKTFWKWNQRLLLVKSLIEI